MSMEEMLLLCSNRTWNVSRSYNVITNKYYWVNYLIVNLTFTWVSEETLAGTRWRCSSLQSTVLAWWKMDWGVYQGLVSHTHSRGHRTAPPGGHTQHTRTLQNLHWSSCVHQMSKEPLLTLTDTDHSGKHWGCHHTEEEGGKCCKSHNALGAPQRVCVGWTSRWTSDEAGHIHNLMEAHRIRCHY